MQRKYMIFKTEINGQCGWFLTTLYHTHTLMTKMINENEGRKRLH